MWALVRVSPHHACWMLGLRKCQQDVKMLREFLIKLREVETKLKEKEGKEVRIMELFEEQRR
jgi:hypothetical protein